MDTYYMIIIFLLVLCEEESGVLEIRAVVHSTTLHLKLNKLPKILYGKGMSVPQIYNKPLYYIISFIYLDSLQ